MVLGLAHSLPIRPAGLPCRHQRPAAAAAGPVGELPVLNIGAALLRSPSAWASAEEDDDRLPSASLPLGPPKSRPPPSGLSWMCHKPLIASLQLQNNFATATNVQSECVLI